MSEYNVKNYTEIGGEVTRIGGALIIEEGASIEGLPDSGSESEYELPVASADTLGGVKIGEGLEIDNEGVLSAGGYELPVATEDRLGGVKIGNGLSISGMGILSVDKNEIDVEFPVATQNKMGIVKPGQGLKIRSTDGLIEFDSTANNVIDVVKGSTEGSITVYMPTGVSRSDIASAFDSRKNCDFCVSYTSVEDDEDADIIADMVCLGGQDDNRAYFHGYRYRGNGAVREYIFGISATDNAEEIDDLLIVRDGSV